MNIYKEFDKLYAKSDKETISQHTENLLSRFYILMQLYGNKFTHNERQLIKLACEYHDLGKCNDIFQKIIDTGRHSAEQIPHGFLSGMFFDIEDLEKIYSQNEIKALLTAVHYHHDREDDYSDADYEDYIEQYVNEQYKKFIDQEDSTAYLQYRLFINSELCALKPIEENDYQKYMLIKGILNKLDYAASAHDEHIEIECDKHFSERIKNRFAALMPAQQFMNNNKNENIIVIAPTGSGKTEGSLLWADNDKTFYTLPLKVSANDIYNRIKNTYKYTEAGLLHSGSIYIYRNNESDIRFKEYCEVKRLAKPLTICTVDQLFKFVFKAIGTEIFGATLKYSKIIIDELQMYEPKIAAMIIYGLNTISAMGGKYAIITATLPPFIENMLDAKPKKGVFLQSRNDKRHIVAYCDNDFDYEKILSESNDKKVLVICNTVKKAQEVYANLPNAHLLHGRFIEKHRKMLEIAIINFARNNKPGIWISTQIVEASLDIDFDILYTEMCSADSLLQRMGRCYRSRSYEDELPNIYVHNNGNSSKIYDNTIFNRSVDCLIQYCGNIFTEYDKQKYINDVFDENAIKKSAYFKTIRDTINHFKQIPANLYSKTDADELFRNINNYNVIPDSIYEANRDIIDVCISDIESKEISLTEKIRAEERLHDMTVPIAAYSQDNIYRDKTPVNARSKRERFYRTQAKYEFDENTLCGRGLLRELEVSCLFL